MLRPRIIPCLLIHKGGLVKTKAFKDPRYVGDPINAVRIFNEKEADELMVLDIDATVNKVEPDFALIEKLAAECRMPICYGGGVTTAAQASRLVDMGVEKVAVNAAAFADPSLISRMAEAVGQQSVVAVIDVRRRTGFLAKGYQVATRNGSVRHDIAPDALAERYQAAGAGEIVVNDVDRDGLLQGYDLVLAEQIRRSVNLPITFLGGAGSLADLSALIRHLGVVGAAAGSLFVFKGKYQAVLINYPTPEQKMQLCTSSMQSQAGP
jgi:cyclase